MVKKMGKKIKWTRKQIKEHVQKIQEAIEKQRREFKGDHFMALTPEEIEQKLKHANSPIITSAGESNTTVGGTVNISCGIYNPDPVAYSICLHLWIGSGAADPVIGSFLMNVDTRFPRLTQQTTIPAGGHTGINFSLKIPTTIEKSNYIANYCLMYVNPFDVGKYFDRGSIQFIVS